MSRPAATLDGARLTRVLADFLDRTMPACEAVAYRLVGTGAALLHGVALPAADIDLLVRERAGVDAFVAAAAGARVLEPAAWLPESAQYYANLELGGVEIGLSTVEVASDLDVVETLGEGPWRHYELLPCGAHLVPTVAPELRLLTELFRDRSDRYEPLLAWLRAGGCDLAFLRRGTAASGVPQVLRDRMEAALAGAPVRPLAGRPRGGGAGSA